jgi:outer membrane biosynthesis protein TonB
MIKEIKTKKEGNRLIVNVICNIRKFAVHPIRVLTTDEVISKIKSEYKILEVLSTPNRPVGNTNRKKMSNFGTWVFELLEKEEEKLEEPKPKTRRKPKPQPEPQPEPELTPNKKPSRTKRSIRGRLSDIANKKD